MIDELSFFTGVFEVLMLTSIPTNRSLVFELRR